VKEQDPVLEMERVVVQEMKKTWDEEPNLHNFLRLTNINNIV
jgi:hypothetical protein